MREVIILGMVGGLGLGCWRYDANHCGNNLGDASCSEGMYCDGCQAENRGCVAIMPSDACHVPGGAVDDEGQEGSSSGVTTKSGTEATSMGTDASESSGATSVGPACQGDDDCADGARPFCGIDGECVSCDEMNDPDGACAGLDPQAGVCDAGVCVQCTAEQAGACDGQTPVCDAGNVCVGCTEHDQCPQSACHLDGTDVGACFEASQVQMIANATEFEAALGGVGDGPAVLVLADGTYNVTMQIGGTAEIAILGSGAPILAGAGIRVVDSFGDSILYFDGVQIVNASGLGVVCTGFSVWVDDGAVRNTTELGMDVSGDCNVHLRRSLVLANNDGGIDMAGGQLSVRNSVIGFNGNEFTSLRGGLGLNGTAVDITYSTIVGNEAMNMERGSVFCVGGESGEIRNSIIAGAGTSVDGCSGLTFLGNAVDDPDAAAAGAEVGPAMSAWFVDLGMNDFHLSTAGADTLMGIAMWQKGDPLVDIDGAAIVTDAPSFPGYDQP